MSARGTQPVASQGRAAQTARPIKSATPASGIPRTSLQRTSSASTAKTSGPTSPTAKPVIRNGTQPASSSVPVANQKTASVTPKVPPQTRSLSPKIVTNTSSAKKTPTTNATAILTAAPQSPRRAGEVKVNGTKPTIPSASPRQISPAKQTPVQTRQPPRQPLKSTSPANGMSGVIGKQVLSPNSGERGPYQIEEKVFSTPASISAIVNDSKLVPKKPLSSRQPTTPRSASAPTRISQINAQKLAASVIVVQSEPTPVISDSTNKTRFSMFKFSSVEEKDKDMIIAPSSPITAPSKPKPDRLPSVPVVPISQSQSRAATAQRPSTPRSSNNRPVNGTHVPTTNRHSDSESPPIVPSRSSFFKRIFNTSSSKRISESSDVVETSTNIDLPSTASSRGGMKPPAPRRVASDTQHFASQTLRQTNRQRQQNIHNSAGLDNIKKKDEKPLTLPPSVEAIPAKRKGIISSFFGAIGGSGTRIEGSTLSDSETCDSASPKLQSPRKGSATPHVTVVPARSNANLDAARRAVRPGITRTNTNQHRKSFQSKHTPQWQRITTREIGKLCVFLHRGMIEPNDSLVPMVESVGVYAIVDVDTVQDCSQVADCVGVEADWSETLVMDPPAPPKKFDITIFIKKSGLSLGKDEKLGTATYKLSTLQQTGAWRPDTIEIKGSKYKARIAMQCAVVRGSADTNPPPEKDKQTVSRRDKLKKNAEQEAEDARLKRLRLHAHVVAEIVDTEASYVESLRLISAIFVQPLIASCKNPNTSSVGSASKEPFFAGVDGAGTEGSKDSLGITENDVRIIFPSIEELQKLHETEFLPPLLATRDHGRGIGKVFKDGAKLLLLYINYLNNYEDGIKRLRELLFTNPRFQAFIETTQRDPRMKGLKLVDMLIKPFQRLTKYLLLLRELNKYTEEGTEKKDIELAMEMVGKATRDINERRRDAESRKKVFEVSQLVQGTIKDFLRPNRRFICEGQFTKNKLPARNKKYAIQLFLFSDQPESVTVSGAATSAANANPVTTSNTNGTGSRLKERDLTPDGVIVEYREKSFGIVSVHQFPLKDLVFEHAFDESETENIIRFYQVVPGSKGSGSLVLEVMAGSLELKTQWLSALIDLRVPIEGFPLKVPLPLSSAFSLVILGSDEELAGAMLASLCLSRAPNISNYNEQSPIIKMCHSQGLVLSGTSVNVPLAVSFNLCSISIVLEESSWVASKDSQVDLVMLCTPLDDQSNDSISEDDLKAWQPVLANIGCPIVVVGAITTDTAETEHRLLEGKVKTVKQLLSAVDYFECNTVDEEEVRKVFRGVVEKCLKRS
eukprot:c10652_g1_i2.p1 GENE.c10652_g1_i2~~c10652_g1_i2.p1  ORF type:complete len:1306 (+),score=268.41 c10652_g1_i2:190-4107(+)